jgi:hypothetical protein
VTSGFRSRQANSAAARFLRSIAEGATKGNGAEVAIGAAAAEEAGTGSEIAGRAVAVAMTGVRGARVDEIATGDDVGDDSEKF